MITILRSIKTLIGSKMAIFKRQFAWILIITFLFLISCLPLSSQETDPFYINLLNHGEKSFLTGNYREAIKELEIAAFGLLEENSLRAKAYIYIGLLRAKAYIYIGVGYYNLRDLVKSKEYLIKAQECLGEGNPHQLKIDEAVLREFNNLI